jgi:hypothetical protein
MNVKQVVEIAIASMVAIEDHNQAFARKLVMSYNVYKINDGRSDMLCTLYIETGAS